MSSVRSCNEDKNVPQNVLFSDCKMENKIEIKEEVVVSDTVLQSEEDFRLSDAMNANDNSDVPEMVIKIEVKEETWWNEKSSPEVKYQPETSPVSDFEVQSENKYHGAKFQYHGASFMDLCTMKHLPGIKGEAKEDFPVAGSTRLYTEAVSDISSDNDTIFTIEDLRGKGSPDLEMIKVHEACESNETETSCFDPSVPLHKPNTPNEDKQSEKPNNRSDNREKRHKCQICNKRFYHKRNLRVHILIHEGKRPYKCNICEKRFIKMEDLRRHTMIHEGKRPYKCKVCEKTFIQGGGLKRHILTHGGNRLYKCRLCKKSFTRKQYLKNHYLIHEGKSIYKCDICKKSFIQMGDLKRHVLIHEGKRPYKCSVCEKNFTQVGGLKRHNVIHEDQR